MAASKCVINAGFGFGNKLIRFSFTALRTSAKYYSNPFNHISTNGRRYLFSSEFLGVEDFKRSRTIQLDKMGLHKEKFINRIREYVSTETNTIFTDDLRSIIYLAEPEKESDLELIISMAKRFHKQNQSLQFSSFAFGPLILRMLYVANKPQIAYQLFMDQSMDGFFDQTTNYLCLMDLLFENAMFAEVLNIMDVHKAKLSPGFTMSFDCVMMFVASCYKMNTKESLQKCVDLLKEVSSEHNYPSSRTVVYSAMLALKQNRPDLAFEFISSSRRTNYKDNVAIINIRVLALLGLGRLEDALLQLKSILEQDLPSHVKQNGEMFTEVLKKLEDSIVKDGSKEQKQQFEVITKGLVSGQHMNDSSFESYLFQTIERPRRHTDGYQGKRNVLDQPRRTVRDKPAKFNQEKRPGLFDTRT